MTMERLGVSGFLVLLFVVTHAAVHDTPSGLRLERNDSNVLQIECRIPYYTAWTERWDTPAPVDLQVSFKGTGAYDSLEVVANMTSSATTPKTYGRFKDVDSMVRAEGRKIAEADVKCENCRSLFVLLPMTPKFSLYGTYYCDAMYIKDHTGKKMQYQVQVNKTFDLNTETKMDGALTVKRMTAHMINISYISPRVNAKVALRRELVDDDSCPVKGATPKILFETVKENIPVLYDNYGTLAVFNFPSQTSEGQSMWTLFVQSGLFCYPKCVYSCEVNGQKCEEKLATATAESNSTITVQRSNSTITDNSTEIGLGVGFGIPLLISIFVCIILVEKKYRFSQERHQYSVSANEGEASQVRDSAGVDASQSENQSSSTGSAMSPNENQECDQDIHDQEDRQPQNSEQT